ncbi:MAG: carboxypeptidase-like regulatory domain-containing protein, partial [Candidatus Acidiferrum sp.]
MPSSYSQTATGSIRGQVTDPSGAAVGGATVMVTSPTGKAAQATTNRDGVFEVSGLAPGKYGAKVFAKGFAVAEEQAIDVASGQ